MVDFKTDSEQERLLKDEGLAFFGAITASISHELNNVIAIIDQSAGLLNDLLAGAQYGRPITNEKLERISKKITTQSVRGYDFIKRLNKFAHSSDEPLTEFDINQLIENLAALCNRFAVLKKVHLETKYDEGAINIRNNPFLIQQAIYLSFRRALNASEKDDTISVTSQRSDTGAVISIQSNIISENRDTDMKLILLNIIVNKLQGKLQHVRKKDIQIISLKITSLQVNQ